MAVPERLLDVRIQWADFVPGEFSYAPCNLCGSFDFKPIESLSINFMEFFLVECRKCSLIWRNPLPGETFLSRLYSEEYFDVPARYPMLKDQVGVPDTDEKERKFRDEISVKVVDSWVDLGVLPYDELGNPRRLLEIGGGRGYLQKAAQQRGWDTLGIEISHYGIKEALKARIPVLAVPLNDVRNNPDQYKESFDVIVFYDFLEHLTDPSQAIRLIRNMLKKSGTIIFRVPKTEGCPTLHLVDHIWHFSTRSLASLLRKERFEVWHSHHSGRYIGSNGTYIDNMTVFAKKTDINTADLATEINVSTNPLGL